MSKQKSKIDWCQHDRGWIEAMIDGEGWLSLQRENRPHHKAKFTYKPVLGISNKNKGIIEKAKKLLTCNNLMKDKKGVYTIHLFSNKLRIILPKIKLIAKEEHRILLMKVLDILSIHRGKNDPRTDSEIKKLEKIYNKMKILNSGGYNG